MTATSGPGAEDIAIIGLGCLYPDAPDVGTFWRNILAKRSAITNPPPEAWDDAVFYDAASKENDRVYCRKGGYLGPLAYFDPVENGIMPRAVEGGEPDQWLALRVAREALRDAGYGDTVPKDQRAALILGKGTYANRGTISVVYHGVIVDYTLQLLKSIHPELTDDDLGRIRADLKRHLPRFDAETAPALISNVTVGRIANRLDLMGPSYTIDAACASSLVAIDIAVKGLRNGEYDMALVGGMQVATPVPVLSLFCRLNALSVSETIRPFDINADGTLLSEGVGMAVLKRRADAERNGDRIYACVKSTGVASDGRAVSVLAPRIEGEEAALRLAYDQAGIPPRSIGLIEAHGTATLVGDATEVEALGRVFGPRVGLPRCALGSVKSMIGHTMPAAGMAGLIKAALALYHKVLPPTLGVTEPSPRLQLERTPFYINTETRPWIHGDAQVPRRAGVNAFGFGGINGHVILEEAPVSPAYAAHELAWDSELCLFAADGRAPLIASLRQVLTAVQRVPSLRLADLTFSINARFSGAANRDVVVGVVATSVEDLCAKIERVVTRLSDPSCQRIRDVGGIYFFETQLGRTGKVAFVFPGEGAQYVNMLADLCRHFPSVRRCFDEMDRHVGDDPRGYLLSDLTFPPPVFSDDARASAQQRLFQMDAAVEAVYTANHALHTLVSEFDINPDAILGHSTGEFSAMRAAGMLDQAGYENWVRELNRISQQATADGRVPLHAKLIAVGASRERVARACARFTSDVWIAMDNCRHQVVVVALPEVADAVQQALKSEGFLFELLAFDRPYHTPAFFPYADELRRFFATLITRSARVPLYSATIVDQFPSDLAEIHQLAYEHLLRPVEFRRTVERMHADGVRVFVEVGPRGNLTAFVDDVLTGRPYAAIPANVSRRSGIMQLNHLLAQLAAHGVPLTLTPLYARRALAVIDLDKATDPHAPARPLGRVKIPTGAPEMGLSPEVRALVRTRARQGLAPLSARNETPLIERELSSAPPAPPPAPPGGYEAPTSPTAYSALTFPSDAPAYGEAAEDRVGGNWPGDVSESSPGAVLSAYLGTMARFLDAERALVGPALGLEDIAAADAPTPLAFVDAVVSCRPGEDAVATCVLDLERYPCLRDHTLGRDVSTDDPSLVALPVVPFTMLAEIMAQTASLVMPGTALVGMRRVRVTRRVALDQGPVALEMHAQRAGTDGVAVRLVVVEGSVKTPAAEGLMVFGDDYPASPAPRAVDLMLGERYRLAPEQLYAEAMFHGPAFQGVASVDVVSPSAARATCRVLDRGGLIAAAETPGILSDFVLLDQPGQVLGFWAAQYFPERFMVLPFHMESLTLHGPLLPAGEHLQCLATIEPIGDHRVRAGFDVVRADGTVWLRIEGWEDRRFDVPQPVHRMLQHPLRSALSRPWPGLTEWRADAFSSRRLGVDDFPRGWVSGDGGLWPEVLASNVLSRRERQHWHGLQLPEPRRIEWLFGRIAAKDAVRDHLQRRHGLLLRPADIELVANELGQPVASGAWVDRLRRAPLVSISHVAGVAVAIAGDTADGTGLGVDLERIGRMRPAVAEVAFTPSERQLLEGLSTEQRDAWLTRLWCAKEACAKATGHGFANGVRAFRIRSLDLTAGAVALAITAPGRPLTETVAATGQDGDWVFATCVIQEGETVRS